MIKNISFVLSLLFFTNVYSNQRALFVDGFNNILGSPSKENKLLGFAKKNNFNTLILYELNKIDKRFPLTDTRKNSVLADFIAKAKLKYGIRKVGASGESATFFIDIVQVYNNSRPKPEEKFDIYNLEFEYWSKKASSNKGYYCEGYLRDNNQPCNRQGSFNYFLESLKKLKKLAKESKHNILIEAYVGYYTQKEISKISKYCDRLLIHTNGKSPKICFDSTLKNLEYLSKINSNIKVSIFFSARMNGMGYWLKFDSLDRGESLFKNQKNKKNNTLNGINGIDGFAYHTYSYLEKSISYNSYRKN
ncbi:hypothetical protein [Polaribacter porphyrae]|uniref:Uncharacterized protein n=1 Tax=Polaribacter porphyrae TaxID=1137780 RepID=A0A2S7WMH6_9FLAO|nr:hypothetical protein [Polaribacter porphyrae]PQJ78815.1 hypothetical protein BTO18_06280 [Polaribacter porphyrae]